MKTAIQFGAGNIGRGFIGGLLSQSGYKVVFADIVNEIIDKLNSEKEYKIFIVDENTEIQTIKNVAGVHTLDDGLMDVAEEAEVITTAVGPNVLPKIAPNIAKCIKRRREKGINSFLNIIACKNKVKASDSLRDAVLEFLSDEDKEYLSEFVGFPNSVVDRIVPPRNPENNDDLLTVRVEPFYEWIVDKAGFKGGIPEIQGMTVTDNLPAYVERKLFTLNTGHAITAYLGKAMGYQTIRSSISDPTIYNYFKSAMEESGAALVKTYGFDPEAHSNYINKIINRFKNPYLDDSVDRVGREPLRKLSRNDRLIKPLMMALEYGIDPENLIVGAAAAFTFNNNDDPQAAELQTRIKNNGITNTVAEVTGLEGHPRIVDRIVEAYQKMKNR
ncbi:MAG: mannitol-1-phosphate 5-dehydrogenase [Clostridiaceae bacterium]|nr:mannitol-1-phosphate 5-dehydrogenase [Clostridiaceae bacterium]